MAGKKKEKNPFETKGRKKQPKASAKPVEALPVYKEYQDQNLKTITFGKFAINTTKGVCEGKLKNYLGRLKKQGYSFIYKGLHLASDSTDSQKVSKLCYLFTAIMLKVPTNFTKEKIIEDLSKTLHTKSIEIYYEGLYEDAGL